jgi:catechol 2,3-dioxygenase-like lactoylglutathione lyase family enzyme
LFVFNLHHVHLMTSDVDETITFWRDHFGAVVALDTIFAGARNVFLQVGQGRIHLYAQAPKQFGSGTVHHLGIETDELPSLTARLKSAGVSVTDIRHHAEADYAMAEGPDGLLLELFQPHDIAANKELREAGYFASLGNDTG